MEVNIPTMHGATIDDIDPRIEIFARLVALEADVAALKAAHGSTCTAVTVTPEELAAHDAK